MFTTSDWLDDMICWPSPGGAVEDCENRVVMGSCVCRLADVKCNCCCPTTPHLILAYTYTHTHYTLYLMFILWPCSHWDTCKYLRILVSMGPMFWFICQPTIYLIFCVGCIFQSRYGDMETRHGLSQSRKICYTHCPHIYSHIPWKGKSKNIIYSKENYKCDFSDIIIQFGWIELKIHFIKNQNNEAIHKIASQL